MADTNHVQYVESQYTGLRGKIACVPQFTALGNAMRHGGLLRFQVDKLEKDIAHGRVERLRKSVSNVVLCFLLAETIRPTSESFVAENATVLPAQVQTTTNGRVAFRVNGMLLRHLNSMLIGVLQFINGTILRACSAFVTLRNCTLTTLSGSLISQGFAMMWKMARRFVPRATSKLANSKNILKILFAVESSETSRQIRESLWTS
jgi:hypothetical protein